MTDEQLNLLTEEERAGVKLQTFHPQTLRVVQETRRDHQCANPKAPLSPAGCITCRFMPCALVHEISSQLDQQEGASHD
jgi:hypothetical protein